MTLALTALLDLFTIILVFLLLCFQAQDNDFVLDPNNELPPSLTSSGFKPGVNISITGDYVSIEGKKVYALDRGQFTNADARSRSIAAIQRAIQASWERRKKEKNDEKVAVIQAHRSIPYRTLSLVMNSAASGGFTRCRLVVEKE
jgi:biopolymer transport protein ExbD